MQVPTMLDSLRLNPEDRRDAYKNKAGLNKEKTGSSR
jgi:hypothetical protein